MVKVDLKTAKPLRREEWGWGGVETKVGRRKECAGVERAQALEWGRFVFKAQVSHLLCNFGQGAQLLGAGVSLPVNRHDYTIDTDGKGGVRSEDDVSDLPGTQQTPRNGNLCRLTRMYLRTVSVRWGKCVTGSSCQRCPFSLDSISVVKKTLCSFRFLRRGTGQDLWDTVPGGGPGWRLLENSLF